jgi:uncharacterized protein (DUF362 family)
MERRKLLKTLAGVGLTSLVAPAGSILNNLAYAAQEGARSGATAQAAGQGAQTASNALPDMAIAKGMEPAELVEAAMKAMGGMGRFVSKGDKVLVKPNIGWDRTPEQAANTNPMVVRTIVDQCFKAGAKDVLVIDFTCNQARRCYTRSGIKDAAEEAGADVSYINERKFKEMNVGGEVLSKWPIYTDIVEADKLINVPIAKHHTLARLSLSMKNWLGAIGGKRNALHQKIDESCVDLSMFFKPTLTILDAVRILKANGPQGGNLKDVEKIDTLAVGMDEVAIDSFGASLFGLEPEDIGYVKIGAERGYGQSDLSKVNVVTV